MNKLKTITWNIKESFRRANFRRDMQTVLFGAWFGEKFSDNPRFLFQYLSENRSALGLNRVVWVTRDEAVCETIREMGYEAYMMDSEESLCCHRTAGVHIICNGAADDPANPHADILGRYSTGAVKINLWHGLCGIKGFGFLSNEYLRMRKSRPIAARCKELLHTNGLLRRYAVSPGGWGDCYYLSTTDYVTELFGKIFLSPRKNFIQSGYPRNCTDVRRTAQEDAVIKNLAPYRFRVLYLPTFRDNAAYYTAPLECEPVRELLARHGDFLWIEKSHSADTELRRAEGQTDNILRLNDKFEINLLLPHVDVVVTDYSSVAFEAMYHRKSVLYYTPDLEYYVNDDRGFITPPETFMAGMSVSDGISLADALLQEHERPGYVRNARYDEIRERFWGTEKPMPDIWEDIVKTCNLKRDR